MRAVNLMGCGIVMAALWTAPGRALAVDASTVMHVEQVVAGWSRQTGKGKFGWARVQINDQFSAGVPDATVRGDFTGCFSLRNASGVTDASGSAYIAGKKFNCPASNCFIIFTVDDVSHVLATYDPSANVMNSGSISCDSTP